VRLREPTSAARMLPDFLVIGAQRSGTSSLYRYLGWHPDVLSPLRKETEYFTREYVRGEGWYRAHFPLDARAALRARLRSSTSVTFEATPDYLFHPLTPERAAHLLPDAKLVVLLRDPVERAFSHYRHMVRLGFETLSFDDALRAEPERIGGDLLVLEADPLSRTPELLRFSYVSRGRYAEQLRRWIEHYPRDRLHVVESEAFFRDTAREYGDILGFLGLAEALPRSFSNLSSGTRERQAMAVSTLTRLRSAFAEPNEDLFALLGRRFEWGS
jgi:hypothetical protein